MRIITLFSILSLITIPMAIDFGEGSNWLWVNVPQNNDYVWIGGAYVLALFIGGFALEYRLTKMVKNDDRNADLRHSLINGLVTMLNVFCFSYLYAFTVAPVTNENGWLSGWLIYLVAGLLPVILHFNSLASDMIKRRHQRLTGEDKVHSIR